MAAKPVFLPGKSRGQRSLRATVHRSKRIRHNLAAKQQEKYKRVVTVMSLLFNTLSRLVIAFLSMDHIICLVV